MRGVDEMNMQSKINMQYEIPASRVEKLFINRKAGAVY